MRSEALSEMLQEFAIPHRPMVVVIGNVLPLGKLKLGDGKRRRACLFEVTF